MSEPSGERQLASIIASVINQTVMPMVDKLQSEINALKMRIQEQEASFIKAILTASMQHIAETMQDKATVAISPIRRQIDDVKKLIETKECKAKDWDKQFDRIVNSVEQFSSLIMQELNNKYEGFSKLTEKMLTDIEGLKTIAEQSKGEDMEPLKEAIKNIIEVLRAMKDEFSSLRMELASLRQELASVSNSISEKIDSIMEDVNEPEEDVVIKDYRPRKRGKPPPLSSLEEEMEDGT